MYGLSKVEWFYGEERLLIADLVDIDASALLKPGYGLRYYRKSELPIWEMALQTAKRSLSDISPADQPSAIVYASETDPHPSDTLQSLSRGVGLTSAECIAVAGHECGNLGLAIQLASDLMRVGRHRSVLVTCADKPLNQRVMRQSLSIFSDGAASCLVELGDDSDLDLQFGIASCSVAVDTSEPEGYSSQLLTTARMGAEVTRRMGEQGELNANCYFVWPNYRRPTLEFLASAVGASPDRLLIGNTEEYGHAHSVDLLMSLDLHAGRLNSGEHVVLSAVGPFSWWLVDLIRGT